MDLSDKNVATVRTTINSAAIAVAVWAVERYLTDYDIDTNSPSFILLVGAVAGVGYRASRELVDRFPVLGRVLFGIDSDPEY